LAVIGALGVASAYQCAYQFFVANEIEIEQYEQSPETKLEPLGIQRGTLSHWQFEHRLYSRGVNGFFTTGNSSGSFSLLASFASLSLFIARVKRRKSSPAGSGGLLMAGAAVAIVLFGLAVTGSKGAIAASLIAAAMFGIYLLFGERLKAHRKKIVVLCILAFLLSGCCIVYYGTTHGWLPGGNSMLVRWQYWQASARMYADHALTGVGPGNFVYFYPRYKIASALETVSDPHNFLLAFLAQYGPLGLAGFLVMVFAPLWRATSPNLPVPREKVNRLKDVSAGLVAASAIAVSLTLLFIRPAIMEANAGDEPAVIIYAVITLYMAPVVAFVVGFWLLTARGRADKAGGAAVLAAVLFCAVIGFLIHNLIDFAIFEPGILTTFWALISCLVALDLGQRPGRELVVKTGLPARLVATGAVSAVFLAFLNYALIPIIETTTEIRKAHSAASYGDFERANALLAAATEDDRLGPAAWSLNARMYLQRFYASGSKKRDLLLRAEHSLLEAMDRNDADFKNFERLTEVYVLLAEISGAGSRDKYLNKALTSVSDAVKRYPGSGRLHFQIAQIAEQLDKAELAVREYEQAVEIENSYRKQFRQMYPGQRVFSRLGEDRYQFAKQRVEEAGKSSSE
jgi:tetratricopeptide (TPR) repeat protein